VQTNFVKNVLHKLFSRAQFKVKNGSKNAFWQNELDLRKQTQIWVKKNRNNIKNEDKIWKTYFKEKQLILNFHGWHLQFWHPQEVWQPNSTFECNTRETSQKRNPKGKSGSYTKYIFSPLYILWMILKYWFTECYRFKLRKQAAYCRVDFDHFLTEHCF